MEPKSKEAISKNVKPCAVINKAKGIQAKVYANPVKDSTIPLFKATFERRYVDKNHEWKSVKSYGEDEVLVLAATALHAWAQMCELRKKAWQAAKPHESSEEAEESVSLGDEEE